VQVVSALVLVVGAVGACGADLVDVLLHVRRRLAARSADEVARPDVGQLPLDQREHHPVDGEVLAAASTTARTSDAEPSIVRTSAPEMRSSARMTRRSRSAEIRYSG
jgi:hypothetical protein